MNNQSQTKSNYHHNSAIIRSLLFCLLIFLTGCVNYDVGVNFDSPNSGRITQNIKVSKQLASLDRSDVRRWLGSIESRARNLEGKVKKHNPEELQIEVPFRNGKDFADKFNQLFHSEIPVTSAVARQSDPEAIKLDSQILFQQNNLVLFERNSLDLSIDLRAINILSDRDKIQVENNRLIDIEFELNTSGLARSVTGADRLIPVGNIISKQLVWRLQPGAINHIEAVFWLPSPLGLGALAIALLMTVGFYLKYRHLPGVTQ